MAEEKGLDEIVILNASELEKAFRNFYTPLCRTVYRILRDKEASEDIVQDVFVTIWKNKDKIKLTTSLKSYLFRAAVNSSFNYLNKSKRFTDLEDPELSSRMPSENGVEELTDAKELEAHINKAIDLLPPACRSIFVLSRYEQMSYKEIAETMEISVKTVENQMGKALKMMREHLQQYIRNMILILVFINF